MDPPPTKPKEEQSEILRLENKINNLTERIISLENKLEKLESKKTQINLHGTTGKILKTEEDFKQLFSFISGGNERQFRLLYSPTFDSNTKEDFHKHCDNKGSTIVLVETSNGRRFGGFTSLSWKSNDQWVKDPCACIFSFDNHKKYKLLLPDYSYYGGPGFGPHFGANDQLGFYNNGGGTGFLDTIHSGNFGTKTYDIPNIEEITLNNTYIMNKFEVYQVI